MYAEEINAAGGLDVGGKKYMLTLVIEVDHPGRRVSHRWPKCQQASRTGWGSG
jgi:hypothetical protein